MARRTAAGSLIGVIAGLAVAVGAVLPWLAARTSRPRLTMNHTTFADLFHWRWTDNVAFYKSFGGIVLVLGALIMIVASAGVRFLTALLAILTLAVGGLWIGLAVSHFSKADLSVRDVLPGAWLVLVGALVALLTAPFVGGESTNL